MKSFAFPDVLLVLGLAMLGGGIAAYDWRVASIVCGGILLAGGIFGLLRGK